MCVLFQGRFEIITLSGSVLNYEVNGSTNRSGNLSVALAGPDGGIVGGSVVGNLVAATQVQVQNMNSCYRILNIVFGLRRRFLLCSYAS